MKAARKARQNTLGTARRKAHTPRNTQRRITAENARHRLAPASLHATRHLCYTRPAPPHRRESAHAATHPTPHHRRKHTPPTCDCLHTARYLRYTRAQRHIAAENTHAATHPAPQRREKHTRRVPVKKQHRRLTPACTRLNTSATRAQCQRIAATFVNSMPLLHARRTFSTALRRDGRASEAPAIHSLPARTLRLYYSAFCVQMRDIILPRGALFHHFLNVYTKGRPAAAKDTPPGDRPRAFIRFCR